MALSIENLFGPDSIEDLEELAVSQTQAATTASQTIRIATALIGDHDANGTSHTDIRELIPVCATEVKPGSVLIDKTMTSNVEIAVPNSIAVRDYVQQMISGQLVYSGYIDIGNDIIAASQMIKANSTTAQFPEKLKKGFYYVLSGSGSINYDGHKYQAQDYLIVRDDYVVEAGENIPFSVFDWFNVQDTDVVKLDATQSLTNKNLTAESNIYRTATSTLIGAVNINESPINLSNPAQGTYLVPNVKQVADVVNTKLTRQYMDYTLGGFNVFTTSGEIYKTDYICNLSLIVYEDTGNQLVFPNEEGILITRDDTISKINELGSYLINQMNIADYKLSFAIDGMEVNVNNVDSIDRHATISSLITDGTGEVYKETPKFENGTLTQLNAEDSEYNFVKKARGRYYAGSKTRGILVSEDGINFTVPADSPLNNHNVTSMTDTGALLLATTSNGKVFACQGTQWLASQTNQAFNNPGLLVLGIEYYKGTYFVWGQRGSITGSVANTLYTTNKDLMSPIDQIQWDPVGVSGNGLFGREVGGVVYNEEYLYVFADDGIYRTKYDDLTLFKNEYIGIPYGPNFLPKKVKLIGEKFHVLIQNSDNCDLWMSPAKTPTAFVKEVDSPSIDYDKNGFEASDYTVVQPAGSTQYVTLNSDKTITIQEAGGVLIDLSSFGINFSRGIYKFSIDVSNLTWGTNTGLFSFGTVNGTSNALAQKIAFGRQSTTVKITNDGNSLTKGNAVSGNTFNKFSGLNGTFELFFGNGRAFVRFTDRDTGVESVLFDNAITLPTENIVQLVIGRWAWAASTSNSSSLTLNKVAIRDISFEFEDFTVKDGRLYLATGRDDVGVVYANYNTVNAPINLIPQLASGNYSSITIIDDKMFLTGFNGTTGIWSTPFEYDRDILFTVNKLKGRSGSIDNPTLTVDSATGLVPTWDSTFIVEDSNLFNDVPLIQIFEKSSGLQVYPSVTIVNNPTEMNPELSFKIGIKSDVDIPNGMYQAKVLYI